MRRMLILTSALVLAVASACSDRAAPTAPPPRATISPSCDPLTALVPCEGTGGGTGGGTTTPPTGGTGGGYDIGYTMQSCTSPQVDSDHDGLDDDCEFALAKKFAPGLRAQQNECNWDPGLDRLGGEYYYGVKRPAHYPDLVRIAYMPAYYQDCGVNGHSGDSEFILVDVKYEWNGQAYTWRFQSAFLSAHCGTTVAGISLDGHCRWYSHDAWDGIDTSKLIYESGRYFDVPRGAPEVYVSLGKHANYVTASQCNTSDAGRINWDNCTDSWQPRRFPIVYRWQNIDFPESGVFSPEGVLRRWPGSTFRGFRGQYATELFRPGARFNGWVNLYGDEPAAYGDHMLKYFDWGQFGDNSPTPRISSVSTNPSPPRQYQPFTLTLNGSRFDPSTAQIIVFQPCWYDDGGWCGGQPSRPQTATATQLTLTLTFGDAGPVMFKVLSGGAFGLLSSGVQVNVEPLY